MDIGSKEKCRAVFKDYPDVMDVGQVSEILHVSAKTIYGLIRSGALKSLKVGRAFRIPKTNVMRYLNLIKH